MLLVEPFNFSIEIMESPVVPLTLIMALEGSGRGEMWKHVTKGKKKTPHLFKWLGSLNTTERPSLSPELRDVVD